MEADKKKREDELPGPSTDLVECFATSDVMKAQFVADSLVGDGIPATLQNQRHGGASAGLGLVLYTPCVVVHAEDWPRAREWIEHYRQRQLARRAAGR